MPGRIEPLITGEIYHVFNRGLDKRPTFTTPGEYERALKTVFYYRFEEQPVKLSRYLSFNSSRQEEILGALNLNKALVKIICYCLMPNHFHLLLRQEVDGGISKYLSNFQNSYTKYFNTIHERTGSLFLGQFRAVIVSSEEQLVHVSRYIHINPYTGFVVGSLKDLEDYSWSSLRTYLFKENNWVDRDVVLSLFKSQTEYRWFILDQAEYQRHLRGIEHLILE